MNALVCGHVCIDITPTITEHDPVPIEQFFHPGSLILVDGIEITPGGAVTNTGLALSRLGVGTTLIGRSGDDSFADILEAELAKRGGTARLSRNAASRTSYSVILTPPGNDRIFLHDPGANNEFTAADVDDEALRGIGVLHFGYPTVMRSIYQDGGVDLRSLFERARAAGALVSLDMALPDPDSEVGRRNWRSFLERVLPAVDVFAPSFEEIAFMVDRPLYERVHAAAGHEDVVGYATASDLHNLGDTLLAMGASIAMIKLGHLGLYMRTADSLEGLPVIDPARWEGREIFSPSFVIDELVAGTGAGDVSIAGLLAAILAGEAAERALRLACAAGAQACLSYDAMGRLQSYEEICRAIDDRWPTIDTVAVADTFIFDETTQIWRGPSARS